MKDKINKLLALSKSSNQHEAELALSKAMKLMEEYQLTHADLIPDMEITHTDLVEIVDQHFIWAGTLAGAAAMLFDCKVINYPGDKAFRFLGPAENLSAAQQMFWHLFKAWKAICNNDYKEDRPLDRKLYRKSHGLGYANSIYRRAKILTDERQVNIKKGTGQDLVVVATGKVEEYMKQAFQTYKPKSRAVTISILGQVKGSQAGNTVVLNAPITNNTGLLK